MKLCCHDARKERRLQESIVQAKIMINASSTRLMRKKHDTLEMVLVLFGRANTCCIFSLSDTP